MSVEKVRVDKTVISINFQVTCTSVRTVCTPPRFCGVHVHSRSFKVVTLCVLSFWRVLELQFRIPFSLRFQTDQFRFIPRRFLQRNFQNDFFSEIVVFEETGELTGNAHLNWQIHRRKLIGQYHRPMRAFGEFRTIFPEKVEFLSTEQKYGHSGSNSIS